MLQVLKRTFQEFVKDDCPTMAASMSYFTAFSLAPLLVLTLLLLGVFIDPSDLQGHLHDQIAALIGNEGARQVDAMVLSADRDAAGGPLPTILGIAALLFGATGAFGALQSALNRAWEVRPDPRHGGLRGFLAKRLLSLGMVGTMAFLLLVSLIVSAALSAFGDRLGGMLGGLSGAIVQLAQVVVSLAVVTLLFAAIFKILPDARVAWRDVWAGALFTTVLFVAGKFLIGFYLSRADPGSAFGAAGALAVILVWIYYSAMIVFFGAEFTQVWAKAKGRGIEPEEGAVHVETRTTLEPTGLPRRADLGEAAQLRQ
ncbi:MAG: YihY/virulence factor BrkB family protein [Gemmatimonadales bacterium]